MSIFYKILLLLLISGLSSMDAKDNPSKEYYYSTGTEASRLRLKDNGSFRLRIQSCTYFLDVKGSWEIHGDTIILNRAKVQKGNPERFDESYSRYIIMQDQSLQNTRFRERFGEWHSLKLVD